MEVILAARIHGLRTNVFRLGVCAWILPVRVVTSSPCDMRFALDGPRP